MSAGIPTREFASYRNRHAGAAMIVCGCGVSLSDLEAPERFLTIGVNDVGRAFEPRYLVVVNPPRDFSPERFRFIRDSRAEAVFTHLDLTLGHARAVRFRLGRRSGVSFDDPRTLDYSNNSPYVAICLAMHLGARLIGVIGVDFTEHHFFERSGRHSLAGRLGEIDQDYARLSRACLSRGVRLVNLSQRSRLRSLPRKSLDAFEQLSRQLPATERDLAPARFFSCSYRVRSQRSGRIAPPSGDSIRAARQRRARPGTSRQSSRPRQGRLRLPRWTVAIDGGRTGRIGAFLEAIARSASAADFRVTSGMHQARSRPTVISVVWNGRHHSSRGPVIYCEHGWLPRSTFQVSTKGINATSHLAPFWWDGKQLEPSVAAGLVRRLSQLRELCLAGERPLRRQPPAEFFLVPLQVEGDTNITRHAPDGLRRMQDLVDELSAADPPLPMVFKQHPSDSRDAARHLTLELRREQDRLWAHRDGAVHRLLHSGRCRGVLSINSNVLHDGLLWNVPGMALGRGVWAGDRPGPFFVGLPESWSAFDEHTRSDRTRRCRQVYADYLITHQWNLEDAADVDRVRRLLESCKSGEQRDARSSGPLRSGWVC